MSDENDKVRRNLVMASAAIVISSWLDISLAGILNRYIDIGHISTTEWKLWVLGFVLMIYLLLRYNFSAEGNAYRVALSDEIRKQLFLKVSTFIQNEVDRYTRTGKESATIAEGLKEARSHLSKTPAFKDLLDSGVRPYLKANIYEQGPTPWEHRFTFTAVFPPGQGGGGVGPAINIAIHSKHQRIRLTIWAWLHAYWYSEVSITNAIPVFIALAATGALWFKVITGYAAPG
jgi:hypothetical protein